MSRWKINRTLSNKFSETSNLISYSQDKLEDFINKPFSLDGFESQIKEKTENYKEENRQILLEVLRQNYQGTFNFNERLELIKELEKPNTFTITTGHQLSLLSGPIYFVYKILHVIKLCGVLKQKYPEQNFIPVFWLASEDHDFEEVRSFELFGQKLSWKSNQTGAVGDFSLEGLADIKDAVTALFQNNPNAEIHDLLKSLNGKNYGKAFFNFVNYLFKDYPLLIVDGNQEKLKAQMAGIFKKELLENFSSSAVHQTETALQKLQIKSQAHARDINLFYLSKGKRERILQAEKGFRTETFQWTEDEILDELHKNPQHFSPNVILRPLYQEKILPNLAYIGGGGEMAYWLELKKVFEQADVTFPLIDVRNSLVVLRKNHLEFLQINDLNISDLLKSKDEVKKEILSRKYDSLFDFTSLDNALVSLKIEMDKKSNESNLGLSDWSKARNIDFERYVNRVKSKLLSATKKKHDDDMKRIEKVYFSLFKHNSFQERFLNFMELAPDGNYSQALSFIYENIDPLEKDLVVIATDK